MNKWTPGPWQAVKKIDADPSEGEYMILCGIGALGYWRGGKSHHDDCNWVLDSADAHLISAAPELYSQLETVVNYMASWQCQESFNHEWQRHIDAGRAALLKARGEA